MESAAYPESAIDQDDIPFPCKGCGEILEEGKAFELAGNRWHIDCFRCSTCGTLLDSDAHLLLLGDGSLICSNCTYSCSSCGEKIEDLAILTGDQAFCSNCFRCRNCKKKIENLRYARTSQGIFCMDCHESLMQRRRKKKGATPNKKNTASVKLDKSLPSLPPSAAESDILSPTRDGTAAEPYPEAILELPSRSKPAADQENILLPSSTYRGNRHSMIIPQDTEADGSGEFLIPVAFDPYEGQRPSPPKPRTSSDSYTRDYFSRNKSTGSSYGHRQAPQSRGTSSESRAPHIAYQEKGSEWAQDNLGGANGAGDRTRQQWVDNVKLQDAAKAGRPASAHSSRSDLHSSSRENATPFSATSPDSAKSMSVSAKDTVTVDSQKPVAQEGSAAASRPSMDSSRPFSSPITSVQYPPKRGDSLESKLHHLSQRKEIGSPATQSPNAPVTSPTRDDSYNEHSKYRARNDSLSALQGQSQRPNDIGPQNSPSLLRHSAGGGPGMDEDMTRVMGSDDSSASQNSESFLRRVSNSVRHARSLSDKGARVAKDLKWPRSPVNGSASMQDISSPTTSSYSPGSQELLREEIAWLRTELQKERQRVVEREQKIAEMEAVLNASADVKKANNELDEKRSTMVVLDAQKEIVLREIGILTEHLEAEKRGNGGALDLDKITNLVLREFVESIHQLKESYAPQIQELIQQRNAAAKELANVNRLKDKSFQEFEQLSSKNAQLAELNNQLVHQIQELYKANSAGGGANGLGIYSHSKDKSMTSIETVKPVLNDLAPSVNVSEEAEPATIVPGPQVVSIRKGQPRKFNWKKGGQNVAKGVKGLKGAFMSSESKDNIPYTSTPTAQDGGSGLPRTQTQDPSRQGFGFFGNQRNKQVASKMPVYDSAAVSADAPPANALYGTDLEQRLEFEKCIIPAIVTRCIQEVELRGMDIEGIYRKSGASTVVQTIRDGFERTPNDYDISDPDLDIHAVTSALKQYFRKLPMPLITYDVYEKIIDTGDVPSQSARIETLQKSLQELPRVHRDVLEFLVFHLKRVVEHEKENLMNSQNIAVVFAPTIMRPESLAREMTDVQKKNEVLKFLVENCQEVFMGMQG